MSWRVSCTQLHGMNLSYSTRACSLYCLSRLSPSAPAVCCPVCRSICPQIDRVPGVVSNNTEKLMIGKSKRHNQNLPHSTFHYPKRLMTLRDCRVWGRPFSLYFNKFCLFRVRNSYLQRLCLHFLGMTYHCRFEPDVTPNKHPLCRDIL